MTTAGEEPMSVYLDRLRSILATLEVTHGERHPEFVDRPTLVITDKTAQRVDEPAAGSR